MRNSHCAPGYFCDGESGACRAALAQGDGCTSDSQCATSFCYDAAADGGGVCCDRRCSGPCLTCRHVDLGPPAGTCQALAPGSLVPGCEPFRCNTHGGCGFGCADDQSCASGHYCADGQGCLARRAGGSTCSRDGECASCSCESGICR